MRVAATADAVAVDVVVAKPAVTVRHATVPGKALLTPGATVPAANEVRAKTGLAGALPRAVATRQPRRRHRATARRCPSHQSRLTPNLYQRWAAMSNARRVVTDAAPAVKAGVTAASADRVSSPRAKQAAATVRQSGKTRAT